MGQDTKEKDQEIKGVVSAVYKIADSIGSGKTDFSVMDEEFFLEILNAGYDLEHSKDDKEDTSLLDSYLKLYREITTGNADRKKLLEGLLYIMADNINYIYKKNITWLELLKEASMLKPIQGLYDVRELFLQENSEDGSYERWDTVVRYLAIENYHGQNDYGFKLYCKMQAARQGENYPEYAEKTFRKLIASFEENGYDKDSDITCDVNMRLLDGSHRMALCLYYNVPQVRATILNQSADIEYSEAWFIGNGFTEEERELIRRKADELVTKCRQSFTCILWPSAMAHFDAITEEINRLYPVISWKEYTYTEETFARLVWGVYHIDDIEDWKVEKKLSYMTEAYPKTVRVVKIAIDAPNFRLKASTKQTLSQAGEKLKATIRGKFMNLIENYFYDIIIHTGDNFKQNLYMERLFEQAFSLPEYFSRIENYSYYIMKKDAPYQTSDFPNTYAFSKDLDIVCAKADYTQLIEVTRTFLHEQVCGYEIVEFDEGENYRIRVELEGYLMFQFDISVGVEGLSENFAKESLANRYYENGYYLPQMRDELCIRADAYCKNTRKKHHLSYILEHKDDWNETYVKNAMQTRGDLLERFINI